MIYKNIISVPRSGQHFTEKCLRLYHKLIKIDFNYCEFYNCCHTRPCKKKKLNVYQKNHDFDCKKGIISGILINDTDKYLFLYRNNLLKQIEANFRLAYSPFRMNKIPTSSMKLNYNNLDILNDFKIYIENNKKYYKNIFKKYLNTNKSNILEIEYSNYINNFNENFEKILAFFNVPINKKIIEIVKEKMKPIEKSYIDETDDYYESLYKFVIETVNS